MDTNKCTASIDVLEKINQQMSDSMKSTSSILSDSFVAKQHKLYAESEDNRKIMDNISENAKRLHIELVLLSKQHNAVHETVRDAATNIHNLIERNKLKKLRFLNRCQANQGGTPVPYSIVKILR